MNFLYFTAGLQFQRIGQSKINTEPPTLFVLQDRQGINVCTQSNLFMGMQSRKLLRFSDSLPRPKICSPHCSACLAIAADSFSGCWQVSTLRHTPLLKTYTYPDSYVGVQ